MRLRQFFFLAAAAAIGLTGCGGGSSTPIPPPPTAPTVTAVNPAASATGVAVGATITATFSQAMNASSLTTSTFTLTGPSSASVSGAVTYTATGSVATFTPSALLAFGTQYTATITTGASDSSGTALAANYSWTFTTAAAPVAPTVTSVTPASGATGVAISTTVMATFSQAMNALTTSTFTLTGPSAASVSGTVTYATSGSIATFTPSAPLAYSTQYTATITTGATDSTGIALAANYTWTFTTAAASAPVVPTVTSVTPASGATNIAIASTVTATFSQAMNPSSLSPSTFTVFPTGGTSVAGTVTYAGTVATYTPPGNLAYNTQYTATITTGATSASGTALAANYTWTFTTEAAPAPTVVSTTPASGATNVSINQALTATFSEAMNPSTLTTSTFTLTGPNSTTVSGAVTYSSSVATFIPSAALSASTAYTATITTGATSAGSGGTPLASNYVWNFTTGAPANLATVDFGTSYQTIRGFGGSTAWLGALTTQQAAALFNPSTGLGLSILRVRIDPTGSAANNWVPSNGAWATELTNATEVAAANPSAIVFASPWTPPTSMKNSSASQPYYNGTGACSPGPDYCGGYLDPTNYAAYATYLEDFVTYFKNGGVSLYGISMQNEPDYSNAPGENYESCSWTAQQMDTWIDGNASVLTTRLIMPESYNFNTAQASPSLSDPTAAALISIVGGHLYGVSPSYYTQAENAGKDVWMTEHSVSPSGAQPAIGDALQEATEVHNSMVTGQYNAYVWWWIWNDPNDGVNYGLINSNTTSPSPTYYGYAIGQFAKFVQPGYVRASATANPSTNVLVSAYSGSASGTTHYVIVVINSGSSAVNQSFTISNGTVTSLTPYQTTSTGGLMPQNAVSVTAGNFTYTLPAQSITTFVQ